MAIDTDRQSGRRVPLGRPLPRIGWIELAILALTAGIVITFALELRYIARSRPPPEIPASAARISLSENGEPAELVSVFGLAVAPSGDIYLADLAVARVDRLDSAGNLLETWPQADAAESPLTEPADVTIGSQGDVYVLDKKGTVYRLEQEGSVTLTIDTSSLGTYGPSSLVLDEDRGRFYVADTGQGRVLVIGTDGTLIDAWGDGDDEGLSFDQPAALALDSEGNVFVAELGTQRIRRFSPEGTVIADWRPKVQVTDLATDPDDRVYVLSNERPLMLVYDAQGKALGEVKTPLEELALPPLRAIASAGPGELIVGAESSLARVFLQIED
jgi:sugar lactone lactonase YvrE